MSVVTTMMATDWRRFTRDRFLFIASIVLLLIYGVIAQLLPEDIQPKWAFATTEAGRAQLAQALEQIDREGKFILRTFPTEEALRNAFDPNYEPPDDEESDKASAAQRDEAGDDNDDEGDLFVGIVFPPDMKATLARGEQPVVRVYVDESMPKENQDVADSVGRLIVLSSLGALPEGGGGDQEQALGPDIPRRTFKSQFRALFSIIVLMMELLAVASLLGRELKAGTVRALLTTTVSVPSYFASKVLFGALLAFAQALFVALITGGLGTNPHLVVAYLLGGAFMFTGMGLMVGTKARDLIEIVTWGMLPIITGMIPAVTAMLPGAAPIWVEVLPTYPLVEGMLAVGDETPLLAHGVTLAWTWGWAAVSVIAAYVTLNRRLQ